MIYYIVYIYGRFKSPAYMHMKWENDFSRHGICNNNNVPSISAINKSLQTKLDMTYKNILSAHAKQLNNIWKVDEYLEIVEGLSSSTLHLMNFMNCQ